MLEAPERTTNVVPSFIAVLHESCLRPVKTPMYHLLPLIVTILLLLLVLQSFTAVLFIRNVIVNTTRLIFLLLRDLWRATQYLYTTITAHTAAHSLRDRVLQGVVTSIQSMWKTAALVCRRIFLGASTVVWSIWGLQDRVRDRIFPAPSRHDATSSVPSDSSRTVQCSGFTDRGRCGREKAIVGGGVWYCFQHQRQGHV